MNNNRVNNKRLTNMATRVCGFAKKKGVGLCKEEVKEMLIVYSLEDCTCPATSIDQLIDRMEKDERQMMCVAGVVVGRVAMRVTQEVNKEIQVLSNALSNALNKWSL